MAEKTEFYQFIHDQEISNSFFNHINCQQQRKLQPSQFEGEANSPCSQLLIKKGKSKAQKGASTKARKSKVPQESQTNPNMKFGHWGLEENKKYHWFLQIYNSHFMNKHMRRMDKIFKTMAIFIGSRQAQQCRSHHQKMEKKYNSFSKILLNLRKQHYGTYDPSSIEAQITQNGIEFEGDLLSPIVLEQQISIPNTPTERTLKSQIQTEQMYFVQENEVDPIASLLCDENYEDNLHFNVLF